MSVYIVFDLQFEQCRVGNFELEVIYENRAIPFAGSYEVVATQIET